MECGCGMTDCGGCRWGESRCVIQSHGAWRGRGGYAAAISLAHAVAAVHAGVCTALGPVAQGQAKMGCDFVLMWG